MAAWNGNRRRSSIPLPETEHAARIRLASFHATMNKLLLNTAAWFARLLPQSCKQAIYKIKPLARGIRRALNRAAPTGMTTVTVAAGTLAGYTLALDLQSEKDYWLGTYEPELQNALPVFVQPGMVAYDVGANIGYVSLLLAHRVGEQGKVYAFEALPANLDRLRQNIALNHLTERIVVVDGAVAEKSGTIRFLVHASGGMGKVEGSAGRAEQYRDSIETRSFSLDEFVYEGGHPAPHIVKMDIEGGEVLALPGMIRLLREAKPVLLLELHGPEAAQQAWAVLSSAGYRIFLMQRSFPEIVSPSALPWKAYVIARRGE